MSAGFDKRKNMFANSQVLQMTSRSYKITLLRDERNDLVIFITRSQLIDDINAVPGAVVLLILYSIYLGISNYNGITCLGKPFHC